MTDTPLMVIGNDTQDSISCDILMDHVKHLVKERDKFLQNWVTSTTSDSRINSSVEKKKQLSNISSESHHLAVELADWKSKLRKQRQEL